MKDFNREAVQPIEFNVDGETFQCVGRIPMGGIEDMLDLVDLAQRLGGVDQLEATPENVALASDSIAKTIAFLDAVMLPESAERFVKRMRDPSNPIDAEQVRDIANWLMEQYSGRPTSPPSPSSNGHGGTGTSSTDGVPAQEPTPEASPSTVSST